MDFYTYLWLRADGTPWYVGKGSDDRAWQRRRGHWAPKDSSRILVQKHPSETDAFFAEIFLISYYGRLDLGSGILRNRSNGGDGATGLSPETRRKMSESHKRIGNGLEGKKFSVRARLNQSEAHKRSTPAKAHLLKMQKDNVGSRLSLEARDKIRRSKLGRKFPRLSVEDRVAYQGRLDLCSVADYGKV